jgi:hypothetical protein
MPSTHALKHSFVSCLRHMQMRDASKKCLQNMPLKYAFEPCLRIMPTKFAFKISLQDMPSNMPRHRFFEICFYSMPLKLAREIILYAYNTIYMPPKHAIKTCLKMPSNDAFDTCRREMNQMPCLRTMPLNQAYKISFQNKLQDMPSKNAYFSCFRNMPLKHAFETRQRDNIT